MNRSGKGFGAADSFLSKVTFDKKLKVAEEKAAKVFEDDFLDYDDWKYLARDAAALVGTFLADDHGLSFIGSSFRDEIACASLTQTNNEADGIILLISLTSDDDTPFECVGSVQGPEWSGDTDEFIRAANEILAREGFAFTTKWYDSEGRHHMIADYAVNGSHCSQKAEIYAEGGTLITPIPVSKHPSIGRALVFAYSLNKNTNGVAWA